MAFIQLWCNQYTATTHTLRAPNFKPFIIFVSKTTKYIIMMNFVRKREQHTPKRKNERERKTKRPRTRKYDTIINIFWHYFTVCVVRFSGKSTGILNNRNKPSYYDKSHTNLVPCIIYVWLLFSCNKLRYPLITTILFHDYSDFGFMQINKSIHSLSLEIYKKNKARVVVYFQYAWHSHAYDWWSLYQPLNGYEIHAII